MKTLITSIVELKNIILEILFSKTDKVSKVSSTSVTNAMAYANANPDPEGFPPLMLLAYCITSRYSILAALRT